MLLWLCQLFWLALVIFVPFSNTLVETMSVMSQCVEKRYQHC